MKTCPSCGGVIGVECFNPTECAEISFAQQQQQVQDTAQALSSVDLIFQRLEALEKRVEHLESLTNANP